jgi:hypothetical protein
MQKIQENPKQYHQPCRKSKTTTGQGQRCNVPFSEEDDISHRSNQKRNI